MLNEHRILNTVLSTTSQGFALFDSEGIITKCNHAMALLMNTSTEMLIGKHCRILLHDDEILKGNDKRKTILTCIDGKQIPCLVHSNTITNEEGTVLFSFAFFSDISECIEERNALIAREKRLQSLIESTPDPMVAIDKQGLIIMVSHQAEKFFGYSKEEVLLKPVEILIPERFRKNHALLRQDFMKKRTTYLTESRQGLYALTSNGNEIPIELHLGFVDNLQSPIAIATLRDITERQRLERENRRNEIRLFDILNLSPIAVRITIKQTGEIVFYNRSYAELINNFDAYGVNPQNYYVHAQDYKDVIEELNHGKQVLNRQIELNLPTRGKAWVLGSYSIIEYQNEQAILGWFYDITERIETQQQLAEQVELQKRASQELNAIFEAALSGIGLLKNKKIMRCNQKLEGIFGYEPGELDGQDTRIWYPNEELYQRGGELSQQATDNYQTYENELPFIKKDGSLFWCRIRAQLLDINDKDKGIVVVINDTTEQRRVTQELLTAKELAESATKMKSSFLANMSHEIRTPMNAIIGLSHLLIRTDMSEKQHEYIKKIQSSSQLLLGVINDILDFSKIEAGKLTIEKIELDLENVLEKVSQIIYEKAIEKELELIFDIAPDVQNYLIGDPLRLGQILLNLGTNAIKFTSEGQINVMVRKLKESDTTVLLRFAVIDTGVGLSKEQMMKLFESFQQADTSTTRKYGGTGLGLAICKNLVEMMGGQIGVNSKLGKGSEFWFTVPLEKSAYTKTSLANDKVLIPDFADILGAKILVVEDNQINQEIAQELLESEGFEVEIAENGQLAIEKIQQKSYDLILMDMQMPVMDGLTATIEIRKQAQFANLPIIAMTANAMQQDKERCFEVGMNDHVSKPIEPEDLWKMLFKWIPPLQNVSEKRKITPNKKQNVNGQIPTEIEGLDTELGLRRVLHKQAFYISILKSFASTQAHTLQQIAKLLEHDDYQTAYRLAHTLKGLLGNIGATALQHKVIELESAIKNHETMEGISLQLNILEPVLMTLIHELTAYFHLENTEPDINNSEINHKELNEVCSNLASLFEGSDSDSIDYFAQHSDLLKQAFPAQFKSLQNKMNNYDFPDALDELKQAAKTQQISL